MLLLWMQQDESSNNWLVMTEKIINQLAEVMINNVCIYMYNIANMYIFMCMALSIQSIFEHFLSQLQVFIDQMTAL